MLHKWVETCCLLYLFCGLFQMAYAQNDMPVFRYFDKESWETAKPSDDLADISDHVEVMRLPFHIARLYYPQLDKTNIQLVSGRLKTTLAARPKWTFLFRTQDKRCYQIIINRDVSHVEGVVFHDLPFNAQVGVLGHELGHIFDYSQMSRFQIVKMGISYLFYDSRCEIEHRTDEIAIKHGLGWQLLDFSDFVLNRSTASPKYKAYKREIYYAPDDIMLLIEAHPAYRSFWP